MRKVNRNEVPIPSRLQNLTSTNIAHLNDHKKISNSVYGHSDVKYSLQNLYFDKCYICEKDVSNGSYDVEHYLPKRHFPTLGYTWSNLHKSCEGCNLAKEKAEFLITDDNGIITDIKLLDPSSHEYCIYDYVRFDIDSKAELVPDGSEACVITKAEQTIKYLNGEVDSNYSKALPYSRSRSANYFLRFASEILIPNKARLREIKLNIDTYQAPVTGTDLEVDQHICQHLINADNEYLSDSAFFSRCTKAQLFPALKINYQQMTVIKETMRRALNL